MAKNTKDKKKDDGFKRAINLLEEANPGVDIDIDYLGAVYNEADGTVEDKIDAVIALASEIGMQTRRPDSFLTNAPLGQGFNNLWVGQGSQSAADIADGGAFSINQPLVNASATRGMTPEAISSVFEGGALKAKVLATAGRRPGDQDEYGLQSGNYGSWGDYLNARDEESRKIHGVPDDPQAAGLPLYRPDFFNSFSDLGTKRGWIESGLQTRAILGDMARGFADQWTMGLIGGANAMTNAGLDVEFWTRGKGLWDYEQTTQSRVAGGIGSTLGFMLNPIGLVGKAVKGTKVGKAVVGSKVGVKAAKISTKIDDAVANNPVTRGIGKAAAGVVKKVSEENPNITFIRLGQTVARKVAGKRLGAKLGDDVAEGVMNRYGGNAFVKPTAGTGSGVIGQATASGVNTARGVASTVNKAVKESVEETTGHVWDASMKEIPRKVVEAAEDDAMGSTLGLFATTLRKRLAGKMSPDAIDDVVAQSVDEFHKHLLKSPKLWQRMRSPFGKMASENYVPNWARRGLYLGTTEALGFQLHNEIVTYNNLLTDISQFHSDFGDGKEKGGDLMMEFLRSATEAYAGTWTGKDGHPTWMKFMPGLAGFAFGTKGIIGTSPTLYHRAFESVTKGLASYFGRRGMTTAEAMANDLTDVHVRMAGVVGKILYGDASALGATPAQQAAKAKDILQALSRNVELKAKPPGKAVNGRIAKVMDGLDDMSDEALAQAGAWHLVTRQAAKSEAGIINSGLDAALDDAGFLLSDLHILTGRYGSAAAETVARSRARVMLGLRQNQRSIWEAYQKRAIWPMITDIAKAGTTAASIFTMTGGWNMVKEADWGDAEQASSVLTHMFFSAWASNHGRAPDGIIVSPDGWRAKSTTDWRLDPINRRLPGFVDARIQMARLQSMLYYASGKANPDWKMRFAPVDRQEFARDGVKQSYRDIRKNMFDMAPEMSTQALDTGAPSSPNGSRLVTSPRGPGASSPGEIRFLTEYPGDNMLPQAATKSSPIGFSGYSSTYTMTSDERRTALDYMKAVVKYGDELPEEFAVGDISPSLGKAYFDFIEENEVLGDQIIGQVVMAMKASLGIPDDAELDTGAVYRAIGSGMRRKFGIARSAWMEAVRELRLLQPMDENTGLALRRFRFRDNDALNAKLDDFFEMSKLFDGPIDASEITSIATIDEKDPQALLGDRMEDRVAEIEDHLNMFLERLYESGVDRSLVLGDTDHTLLSHLTEGVIAVGRNKLGDLIHFNSPMALTGSGPNKVIDRDIFVDSVRGSGIVADIGGSRAVLRPVSRDVLKEMKPHEREDYELVVGILKNMPDLIWVPPKGSETYRKLMIVREKDPGSSPAVDLSSLWSGEDRLVPDGRKFDMRHHSGGIAGALAAVGISAPTPILRRKMLAELRQLNDLSLSDAEAMALQVAEEEGLIINDRERGRLVRSPWDIVMGGLQHNAGSVLRLRELGQALRVALRDKYVSPSGQAVASASYNNVLAEIVEQFEQQAGRSLTDAEIRNVENTLMSMEFGGFTDLFNGLIAKGAGKLQGWATSDLSADGVPTHISANDVTRGSGFAGVINEMMMPMSSFTTHAERNQMLADVHRAVSEAREKLPRDRREKMDWYLRKLSELMDKNDTKSIAKLRFMLEGVGVLRLTGKDGKVKATIDLTKIKSPDIDKMIQRVEALEMGGLSAIEFQMDFDRMTREYAPVVGPMTDFGVEPALRRGYNMADLVNRTGIGQTNLPILQARLFTATQEVRDSGLRGVDMIEMIRQLYSAAVIGTAQGIGGARSGGIAEDIMLRMDDAGYMGMYSSMVGRVRTTKIINEPNKRLTFRRGGAMAEGEPTRLVDSEYGNYTAQHGTKKRGVLERAIENMGTRSVELSRYYGDWGNLIFDTAELIRLDGEAWSYGFAPHRNNVALDMRDGMDEADPAPWRIVLIDNKFHYIRFPYTPSEMTDLADRTQALVDRVMAHVPNEPGFSRRQSGLMAGSIYDHIAYLNDVVVPEMRRAAGAYNVDNAREMVASGTVSKTDLYNLASTFIREALHGPANISQAEGSTDVMKRYGTIMAPGVRSYDPDVLAAAIDRAQELGLIDDASRFYRDTPTGRQYSMLMVAEDPGAKVGAIGELDGPMYSQPWMTWALGAGEGYDLRTGVITQAGSLKAFYHGQTAPGAMSYGKPLITSMSRNMSALASHLGVAFIMPRSTMKFGHPADGYRRIPINGEEMYLTRAAAQFALGGQSEVDPSIRDHIVWVNAEDIHFQFMPHNAKHGAAISAQSVQSWMPRANAAFFENQDFFPFDRMLSLTKQLMGGMSISHQALYKALILNGMSEGGPVVGDFNAGREQMAAYFLADNPGASPMVFVDRQVKHNLLNGLVEDALFKGHTPYGSKNMTRPDETHVLGPGEKMGSPHILDMTFDPNTNWWGSKRYKRLQRDSSGAVISADGVDYTPADASLHMQTFLPMEGTNHYNEPGTGVTAVPGREVTWVENRAVDTHEVHSNGSVRGFMANQLEDWYAGGGLNSDNLRPEHLLPLYRLFVPERLPYQHFDAAAGIVNNAVAEILKADSINHARNIAERMLVAMAGDAPGTHDSLFADGPELVDDLMELGEAMERVIVQIYTPGIAGDLDVQRGRSVGGERGNMLIRDIWALRDAMLGSTDGSGIIRGYDFDSRYRDPSSATNPYPFGEANGRTPTTYAMTSHDQRMPSSKPDDLLTLHTLGYLNDELSGTEVINAMDFVHKSDGDYDGDSIASVWSMTPSAVGEAARLRNLTGGLGDLHSEKMADTYTFLVPEGQEYNPSKRGGNAPLKYAQDNARADILKGKITSNKGALEWMIANEFTLEYVVGGQKYVVSPRGNLGEVQDTYMPEIMQTLIEQQRILDVPGSYLPDDLANLDIYRLMLGAGYQSRRVNAVTGEPSAPRHETISQRHGSQLLDREIWLMTPIMDRITEMMSVSRDVQTGETTASKPWTVRKTIAKDWMADFGSDDPTALSGALRGVLGLDKLNPKDPKDKEKLEMLQSIRITRTNNKMYPDRLASWIIRLDNAMNSDLARKSMERAEASNQVGEVLDPDSRLAARKLAAVVNSEDADRYYKMLLHQDRKAGKNSKNMVYPLRRWQNKRLDYADAYKQQPGKPVPLKPGSDLHRQASIQTVQGLSLMATQMSVETGIPRGAAEAAARKLVAELRRARSDSWMKQNAKNKTVDNMMTMEMHEALMNASVAQVVDELMSLGASFEEAALRILDPVPDFAYTIDGRDMPAFKEFPQDLVRALIMYDPSAMSTLMGKIGENSAAVADAIAGSGVARSRTIQELVRQATTHSANLENTRMRLREFVRLSRDRSAMMDAANLTMTKRVGTRLDPDTGDFQSPHTTNRIMDSLIDQAIKLEMNPGLAVQLSVRVGRNSQLPAIKGLRTIFGEDWSEAMLIANPQRTTMESLARRLGFTRVEEDRLKESLAKKKNDKRKGAIKANRGKEGFQPPKKVKAGDIKLTQSEKDLAMENAVRAARRLAAQVAAGMSGELDTDIVTGFNRSSNMEIILNKAMLNEAARREIAEDNCGK